MGRPRKVIPSPIAERDEVLQLFTRIMRGELMEETVKRSGSQEERTLTPPKISERCKAAELLGKYQGMDGKEERQTKGDVANQIKQVLAEMHDHLPTSSP